MEKGDDFRMIEIKGRVNSAVCYAKTMEKDAQEQIQRMCHYDLVFSSKIRIMPDVHAGKGCTIGTTMTVKDKVCPNIVGVDIGCGMYTIHLKERELDLKKVDEVCYFIPSGMQVWESAIEEFDFQELRCYQSLKKLNWLACSLGTLGGGNHFIEIDQASDGSYYLIIHSGSRNLGKQVADIYQKEAVELHKGKEDYLNQRKTILWQYKQEGRQKELQSTLKKLQEDYRKRESKVPEDLCWLYGQALEDYLHDIELCQKFACRNREQIAKMILEKTGMTALETFHTIHNYIDTKEMILRKGAIAAHAGEKVLIPMNMRDGSVLARGRGNPEWNYSAPHGAGRIMSRTKAKKLLNMAAYKKSMEGIYTTSVNEMTLDEAPMAYKSRDDVIDVIRETVDVIDIMKPVYNFKSAEEGLSTWKNRTYKRKGAE